jgi:hypothetical protein
LVVALFFMLFAPHAAVFLSCEATNHQSSAPACMRPAPVPAFRPNPIARPKSGGTGAWGDRRHHREDVGNLLDHRFGHRRAGRCDAGNLPQRPAGGAGHPRGKRQHHRRSTRRQPVRNGVVTGVVGREVAFKREQPVAAGSRKIPQYGPRGVKRFRASLPLPLLGSTMPFKRRTPTCRSRFRCINPSRLRNTREMFPWTRPPLAATTS